MNFQITRIRLASVGPEPARYDPLDLDLRTPDRTGVADSVLYLPNTGGKTVLMRLLFSVLHPPIVEKIGTEETKHHKKNVVAYVLDGDTSHVVIEWRHVEAGRFCDDEVLITGLAMEWPDRRRPAEPSIEQLNRLWYSIRGSVSRISIDRLSFDTEVSTEAGPVRRRLTLHRFKEQLDELESSSRPKLEVSTTTGPRKWVDHLDKLGLDGALFRYQGEMNHNEAGASAIARFKEDRDFIKFFLDAVFDPAELDSLDREFEEVAGKVRRIPEYEQRLRFEKAAVDELEPLVGLVAVLTKARADAQAARSDALILLAAFHGAHAITRTREEQERQRGRQCDTEMRRLTAIVDRFRDESREYRRLGAALWLKDAETQCAAADKRTKAADLDLRAWTLTEDLARLNEAIADVKILNEAYTAQLEELRPLQTARDDAAVRLARYLSARAALAQTGASAAETRAGEARKRADESRQDRTKAEVEAATLDVNGKENERRLADVEAFRNRLVVKGLLAAEDRTRDAHGRETARASTALDQIDSIEDETSALETERAGLDDEDRRAAPHVARLGNALTRVAEAIARVQAERKELATHAVVIELAESSTFDLELVASGIAERLLGRAREADRDRLELELQGAEDRRAVDGLEKTGLLPPPQDVEAALARLEEGGISGALPGTRYVGDAIAAERRNAIVTNRADLVGGIVLTYADDLAKARAILATASLNPATIIAVGTTRDLSAVEDNDVNANTIVVPPAEAIWDRTAAGAERARREARLNTWDVQRAELDQRAAEARRLADALVRHAAAYPAGWLALRTAEQDQISDELSRLNEARTERDRRRAEISETLQMLRKQSIELRKIARDAEQRANELQHLLEQEASVVGLAEEIERQRVDAKYWTTIARELDAAAKAADGESEQHFAAARDQHRAYDRMKWDLAQIRLTEVVPEPSADEAARTVASDDLFELRTRFSELDRQLSAETTGSDLAFRRDEAIKHRDKLAGAFEMQPTAVRERAVVLLALPEASDPAGRRAAAERATTELTLARAAELNAQIERKQADDELENVAGEIQKQKRSVTIPEDRAPRDRHHAARLAAEARQNAENTQIQVTAAQDERDRALEAADAAKKLVESLQLQMRQLRMVLKLSEAQALPNVAAFVGEADAANELGSTTAERLTVAIQAETDADKAWRERDAAVRTLLLSADFSGLNASDPLYRRLQSSLPDVLARDAAELVMELRSCIGILQSEVATLEEDRKLATTSLAKSVHKAVSSLRLAESRSRMPPRLRDWSGEPFLEIRYERAPAEEMDARLSTFVTETLQRNSDRPTGTKLLMLALERAVGAFRVKILKPNEAFAPIRVSVAELSSPSFSNGQRATVATALMLMLSEMRRQTRSAARDASVGALLLDNPLGNANAGFLIDVQRTVAAAAGIQLIYTTGIADLNALRRFSNVIALSNDAARRTMRRYVRANAALLDLLAPSADGPGGRLTAHRVVAVTGHETGGH